MAKWTHAGGGMGQGTADGRRWAWVISRTTGAHALPTVAFLSQGTVIRGKTSNCVSQSRQSDSQIEMQVLLGPHHELIIIILALYYC